jgi:RecB family exonuclease
VITPRATRLVRADGLHAFHRALLSLATRGDFAAVRRRAILVPSRSAAEQLRQTLEALWFGLQPGSGDAALALPDLLTRGDWYQRMHEAAVLEPPMLTPLEREVLLAAAARDAIAEGCEPPFRLRPGLVGEMLAFYDVMRAFQRSVDAFERVTVGDLEPRTEADRGAERLLRQTRFLVAAFRAFERRVAAAGKLDEHALRARLLDGGGEDPPYTHVVVAMGDRVAEPAGGLYPADVDLLMRLPGIDTIHIVATRAQLASGLAERLHDLIPELDEVDEGHAEPGPRLVAPKATPDERLYFVSRDREEELRAVARWIKHEARDIEPVGELDRVAVVFKRPLPYVYLARTVFASAGIDHQASDALPLAAEPMAAVLDLVVSCVEARFARTAIVALLRSPHLALLPRATAADDIDAFERKLADTGYLGDAAVLAAAAEAWRGAGEAAARAAAGVVRELQPLAARQRVSAHASCLLGFLESHERTAIDEDDVRSRHLRARRAVLGVLEELRRGAVEFDDPEAALADVASTIRRRIESQTFSPRRGGTGVQLVDAQAARYGRFDAVFLAGLAEGDWPEPTGRNIFYPGFLLSQLGWPPESARAAAAGAAFSDLLRLARERVRVSTFTLEDDSIVNPSPLLEELPRAGLALERAPDPDSRIFTDEALAQSLAPSAGGGDASAWFDLRSTRSSPDEGRFHGVAGPGRQRRHTVTAIDQFLQCPFKYFAGKVLNLPEDVVDEPARTPRMRGQFVHEVLQDFYQSWQASGGQAIFADQLDAARAHFAEVAERRLATLPTAEAGLERLRILGSVGTPGLGEIVMAAEASRAAPVRERLLEFPFDGEFAIQGDGTTHTVRLRGKADRIDLLADGRFRLVDYKNGKAPDPAQTIQLPIYAVCIQQELARVRKESWQVAEAGYLAFGEAKPDRVVIRDDAEGAKKIADGQARLIAAIDAIDRGDFPPRPAAPRLCGTCPYATVCRKDFVDAD